MKTSPIQAPGPSAGKADARPYTPQAPSSFGEPPPGLRRHIYRIVFESDTRAGRRFDILLVILILMSIIVVIVVIVFISILSGSAAAALTSTGTVILGLSWLLQATAQEFLQVSSHPNPTQTPESTNPIPSPSSSSLSSIPLT